MGKELQNLISSFSAASSVAAIEIQLTNFCMSHGYSVSVSQFLPVLEKADAQRSFIITFSTPDEAVVFANRTGISTFGFNGVMVKSA